MCRPALTTYFLSWPLQCVKRITCLFDSRVWWMSQFCIIASVIGNIYVTMCVWCTQCNYNISLFCNGTARAPWPLVRIPPNSSNEKYMSVRAAWRSVLHVWLVMWKSWVRVPSKAPVVSLSKKIYPYCLLLVGSRNEFEGDFTIELKWIEGLIEDWLKCQISPPR